MPKKQISNFGHLMEILNISAIYMSNTINIDKSSISKWRTGKRNLPVDAPYFKSIVDYLIQKNETIGGELLEDFFGSIYPEYDPKENGYLSKCIRNYVLNFESCEKSIWQKRKSGKLSTFSCVEGLEGRRMALIEVLETAEKTTEPTTIFIYSFEQLEWGNCNMVYLQQFNRKIKKVLSMGHKVEFLFNVTEMSFKNTEVQNLFVEYCYNDNVSIYIYTSRFSNLCVNYLYIISGKMVVTGYCLDSNTENSFSFTFYDKKYACANERIIDMIRSLSTHVHRSSKLSDLENIIQIVRNTVNRAREYFYSSRSLSFVSMSEELLNEVLTDNNITETHRKRILEAYQLFRTNIENTPADSPCGFYYVLDEIVGNLSFNSTINYFLSLMTNKYINISREQHLRHFRDTAELILSDSRYKVILHYTKLSRVEAVWYCGDAWILSVNKDENTDKIKYLFCDNIKAANSFRESFRDVYYKTPQDKKDNTYVAELFLKIANGEQV